MSTREKVLTFFCILLFIILFGQRCESPVKNESPICKITSPSNNSKFIVGETISIVAEADDPDGDLEEVCFYVDDVAVGSDQSWQYTFEWDTEDYEVGYHEIKAEAIDDENLKSEAYINIELQSAAINGVAYYQPEAGSFDIIGVHEDGEIIALDYPDQDIGHAIYISENGEPAFHVWAGEDGLPVRAYIDGQFLLFRNYTNTTVDIALVTSDGQIEIQREINIESVLNKTNGFSLAKASAISDWIRWGGHALGAAGCIGSIIAAGGSFGALSPLAMTACGATAVGILTEFAPDDTEFLGLSSTAISTFASAAGCATANAGSCWDYVGGTVLTLTSSALEAMENNESSIESAEGALESGFGDIQITLTWNSTADLDLYVIDPYDEEIYWDHDYSESGGELDVDDRDGYGPENIYWPAGEAPNGTYEVYVHFYDWEDNRPNYPSYSDYNVLVNAFGNIKKFSGSVSLDETNYITSFNQNTINVSISRKIFEINIPPK